MTATFRLGSRDFYTVSWRATKQCKAGDYILLDASGARITNRQYQSSDLPGFLLAGGNKNKTLPLCVWSSLVYLDLGKALGSKRKAGQVVSLDEDGEVDLTFRTFDYRNELWFLRLKRDHAATETALECIWRFK